VFELADRIAVVTGGGGARVGTGAGIARTVAAQGAYVVVADKNEAAAEATAASIVEAGGRAEVEVFDVRDEAVVLERMGALEARLGRIDILVNSAGGGSQAQFRDMPSGQWARIVDLNLHGVVHCTRAVVDGMCQRGWGRIITIASSAAFMGSTLGLTPYAAGKAGAVGFTRQLAMELGPYGVTANCIAPGLVRGVEPDEADRQRVQQGRTSAIDRVGTPEDVGALCVYLASEEAAWMTGQTLHLNGGAYTT
jgi:NAD(P)-dependent dehydrogenase (short-subunit alcohol dehydrogenase family)